MGEATRYRVTGMDCASCAARIERAVKSAGVTEATISTASQVLTLNVPPRDARLIAVERAVTEAGYHLDRIYTDAEGDQIAVVAPHETPAYRRALWIVIALNAGYGVIEMIGGFIVGSQALKADALDFLGDGLITFFGVLAIGWSMVWRARSALVQGLFLGALGLGVVGNTVWRVFSQQPIEAGLMGSLALVALIINILAAAVLIPHRAGDSNVKAVWLFSRNDAIGNAGVVLAAGLVAWTDSVWPDLIAAFAIAALFLHSAWVIIRDAERDIAGSHQTG